MSKVFIAWSGENEIADAVAKKICASKSGYDCIIGGDLAGKSDFFVGGMIIEQMKQCDQAILLVEKHGKTGAISSNLMFEWGYLLAKLQPNKIHNYFINIGEDYKAIPSDLLGVWAKQILTQDKSAEQVAEEIASTFLNSQKNIIAGNKMSIIIEWYKIKDYILRHHTDPVCSDYELAQYLLCYIYSAQIFKNIARDVAQDLDSLAFVLRAHADVTKELTLSLKGARVTMELINAIKNTETDQYISMEDYYDLEDKYTNILENCAELDDSEVSRWIKAVYGNFLGFTEHLVINNPQFPSTDKAVFNKRIIDRSKAVIQYCNDIEKHSAKDNKQFCELLRAYMYRNIFCALREFETNGGGGFDQEGLDKLIKESLTASFEERKSLYNYYQGENINGTFFENVEMEYFLSMAECLQYETDGMQRSMMESKLSRYIARARRTANDKTVFVQKIADYIKTE